MDAHVDDPVDVGDLLRGAGRQRGVPKESTYVAAAALVATTVLVALAVLAWSKRRRRSSRLDWTSQYLGRGREAEGISEAEARRKARSWGLADESLAGVCRVLGGTVAAGRVCTPRMRT